KPSSFMSGEEWSELHFANCHVPGWDVAIVGVQLRPLLAAHEAGGLSTAASLRAALRDQRSLPSTALPVAQVNEKDFRIRAERREHLGAVDDVMRSVGFGAGDKIGDCGAGVGLAHAEADHHVPCE